MSTPKRKPTPAATFRRSVHAVPATAPAPTLIPRPVSATDLLSMAASTITQRGKERDSGQGQERSMAATVAAFNAIEGTQLTERQGWAFMQVLKMVRGATTARNGLHNPDDALDGAAYAALAGEAAAAAHAAQLLREGGAQ